MKKLSLVLISLALVAGATATLGGCSSTIENRDPSGEPFPSVENLSQNAPWRFSILLLRLGYVVEDWSGLRSL